MYPKAFAASGDRPTDHNVDLWIGVWDFNRATTDNEAQGKEAINKILGETRSVVVQVCGDTGWPNGAKCCWKNIRVHSPS